jgi:hypothetical protein
MRYSKHIDKLKRFMAFLHLFGVAPLPDPRRGPSEVAGVWCQEGWVSSTAIGSLWKYAHTQFNKMHVMP